MDTEVNSQQMNNKKPSKVNKMSLTLKNLKRKITKDPVVGNLAVFFTQNKYV